MTRQKIAFQGEKGAYSQVACTQYVPECEPLPCATFLDMFKAVQRGDAAYAMVPIENSLAGRVSDIHHLLPDSGLHIIAENFLPIQHQLISLPGNTLADIKTVRSHAMALGQCRHFIDAHNLHAEIAADTAGAARALAKHRTKGEAVIASDLAARIYGLEVLAPNVEDASHNATRFLTMSREPEDATAEEKDVICSFVFQVRNIPSALYKALGGFATNGINMTKLESYMENGKFNATLFYADIEGHPENPAVRRALEELSFFSAKLDFLGVYKADPYRQTLNRSL